jgi:endonuclease G
MKMIALYSMSRLRWMTHYAVALVLGMALFASPVAYANTETCPQHFAGGEAPAFINDKLAARTIALCFEAFAIMHSGLSRTPLWAAELITPESIAAARRVKRKNRFHAEPRLPASDRAELRDYARSGFDRGHMIAAANMPTKKAQYESFSLANIVPQHPDNNQGVWSGLEEATRALALRRGALYVITGPLFEGKTLQRLNSRVLVPTHVFKAIYDPARNAAAAYISENREGAGYHTISIEALENRLGINLFPAMPQQVKRAKMPLPKPDGRHLR